VNEFVRFGVGGNLVISLDPSMVSFKIGEIVQEPRYQFGMHVKHLVHEKIDISDLFLFILKNELLSAKSNQKKIVNNDTYVITDKVIMSSQKSGQFLQLIREALDEISLFLLLKSIEKSNWCYEV